MLEALEALLGPLAALVDVTALVLVIKLAKRVDAIARRVGVVEKRTTPPPGSLSTITDIASGPVRVRAATDAGKR